MFERVAPPAGFGEGERCAGARQRVIADRQSGQRQLDFAEGVALAAQHGGVGLPDLRCVVEQVRVGAVDHQIGHAVAVEVAERRRGTGRDDVAGGGCEVADHGDEFAPVPEEQVVGDAVRAGLSERLQPGALGGRTVDDADRVGAAQGAA